MRSYLKLVILFVQFNCFVEFPLHKNSHIKMHETTKIQKYLHTYGYLESMDRMTDSDLKQSIMEFQSFMGINSKNMGEVDSQTIEKMNMPRCGRPDKGPMSMDRIKRYAFLGNETWNKRLLTYRVNKYTPKLPSALVDAELSRAVEMWADYSKIKLKPAQKKEAVDINIMFDYIDAEEGILGFALSPPTGIMYLDEYEKWSINSKEGVDLFQLTVHELGHSLGLDHSDNENAVMFPLYYYRPFFTLHADDILGMKTLYKIEYPVSPPTKFKNNNLLCQNAMFNAIFHNDDQSIYIVKDNKYWELTTDFLIIDGPRLIHEKWPEIPTHLDTAFTDLNGITFFFKGSNVWSYNWLTKQGQKAKLIEDMFPGIPDDIHSVFVWSGNGKVYFFKGDQYWEFNRDKPVGMKVAPGFPRPVTDWNGVPNQFEAATILNGSTYFFKNELFYRYNDMQRKIEDGYPKSIIIDLLACTC